jgi:hypothetical protein
VERMDIEIEKEGILSVMRIPALNPWGLLLIHSDN